MRRSLSAAVIGLLGVLLTFNDCVYGAECEGVNEKNGCGNQTRDAQAEKVTNSSTVSLFLPTPIPTLPNNTSGAKGRALNFTSLDTSNGLKSNLSSHDSFDDLSDVTINDDEEDSVTPLVTAKLPKGNLTNGACEKGGLTYDNGQKIEIDCDSICTCKDGKMECTDRCQHPFIRRSKTIEDPLCTPKSSDDHCCAILVCSADIETEPLEICVHNNRTYHRGEQFNKGCEEICYCGPGGKHNCKPRCSEVNKTSDRCVIIPDPKDSCCKTVLCDVTLDEHDVDKDDSMSIKLLGAKFINSSTIQLQFDQKLDPKGTLPLIDISNDTQSWKSYSVQEGGFVRVQEKARYIRLDGSKDIAQIQEDSDQVKKPEDGKSCAYKGRSFRFEEEYNDNCTSLCVCKESGMMCLDLDCPTYFGTDVLDPTCVVWETVPPNFVPKPPNCCPEKVHCKSNGSCLYQGEMYANWQQIPENVTGCEKRCYCEMGKIECQNVCPAVTALPPPTLPCPPHEASLSHIPEDDCCMYWVCNSGKSSTGQKTDKTNDNKNSKNDSKSTKNKVEHDPLSSLNTKQPSKVLGPLLVYTNNKEESSKENPQPELKPDENPFYHKSSSKSKPDEKTKKNKDKNSLTPDFVDHSTDDFTIPQKNQNNKNKLNKNQAPLFVTPPPAKPTDNFISDHNYNVPLVIAPAPGKPPGSFPPHIQIHGKGDPVEFLHFINQHPELSNYPAGSVLEIHNVPQKPSSFQNGQPQGHQIMPYVVPGQVNDIPPGVSLEQFLQELHKNVRGQDGHSIVPFTNQFNNNIGLAIAHSGPTSPKANATYQGGINHGFPGQFPNNGPYGSQDDITVNMLDAIDPHTIRLAFTVPPVIVGLHGRVEVRYTHKNDNDINTWEQQIFAPPNDLIATPQLEFDLLGLKADTEYKIKITITLRDLHNEPTSRIYKIKTPAPVTSTAPPTLPIEPDLAITDINSTWVTIMWRKFSDYELQFIDGVQLRFKEIEGKIYAATPLIHRAVTSYTLENLKPNTKYEIGIFFIPFPGQQTELHAEHMLHFTTANEIDTYGFNVTLEISHIKSSSVEISWNGVPYPEDKYVNIYRAIYQSDTGKEDQSTFKMAKRDSPTKSIITDLKPGTRYRLWLEVYLTNGKIKTSNVQDFITKPRTVPSFGASSQHDKLSGEAIEEKQDYYGPLVIVAILAAMAILCAIVMLYILLRRHNQNKAAITPPSRISQSAYDNPTYKVEIQQETNGL